MIQIMAQLLFANFRKFASDLTFAANKKALGLQGHDF